MCKLKLDEWLINYYYKENEAKGSELNMTKDFFKIEASNCLDDLFVNQTFNILLNLDNVVLEQKKDDNREWFDVICKDGKKYCVSIEEAERIRKELGGK